MEVFSIYILCNFGFVALWLALICALVSVLVRGCSLTASKEYETFLRYLFLLPGGIVSIYTFFIHGFGPSIVAETLHAAPSSFQWGIASANLGFGVLCLLSIGAGHGFRLATIIGLSLWLWTDAASYIMQSIEDKSYIAGDLGIWVVFNVLTPALMILFYSAWRRTAADD